MGIFKRAITTRHHGVTTTRHREIILAGTESGRFPWRATLLHRRCPFAFSGFAEASRGGVPSVPYASLVFELEAYTLSFRPCLINRELYSLYSRRPQLTHVLSLPRRFKRADWAGFRRIGNLRTPRYTVGLNEPRHAANLRASRHFNPFSTVPWVPKHLQSPYLTSPHLALHKNRAMIHV